MSERLECVARAIEGADIDWSSRLTRLVDGVHTYELKLAGVVMEFTDNDELTANEQLYAAVNKAKRGAQAAAAIAAMERWRAVTDENQT